MTRRLAIALLALGALPASAHAGTAAVEQHCIQEPKSLRTCTAVMTYTAAPGETNVVQLGAGFAGEHLLRDEGAPITPGDGCQARSEREVACVLDAAVLVLGDGADRATVTTANDVSVDAGDGDDAITGGPLGALLRGGPGADTISGGAGNDTLDGGPGPDVLFGGGGSDVLHEGDSRAIAAADVIDGGDGRDVASYVDRALPVTVDLAREDGQGGEGENDVIRAVEAVEGGGGDDTLSGGDGDDDIRGGYGRDRIRGRGGDDALAGDAGADRIFGGGGRDRISLFVLAGNGADRVACGAGRDEVEAPDGRDLLEPDCERIHSSVLDVLVLRAQPVRVRGALAFRVPCPGTVDGCAGRLVVRTARGRLVGRVRYRRPRNDADRYLTLRVPARRVRGDVLRVSLADDFGDVCPQACAWRIRVP